MKQPSANGNVHGMAVFALPMTELADYTFCSMLISYHNRVSNIGSLSATIKKKAFN